MKLHIINGKLMGLRGASLKDAMVASGHTEAELARRCGVTRQAVSLWLRGDVTPRPEALLHILNTYGPSVFVEVPQ